MSNYRVGGETHTRYWSQGPWWPVIAESESWGVMAIALSPRREDAERITKALALLEDLERNNANEAR